MVLACSSLVVPLLVDGERHAGLQGSLRAGTGALKAQGAGFVCGLADAHGGNLLRTGIFTGVAPCLRAATLLVRPHAQLARADARNEAEQRANGADKAAPRAQQAKFDEQHEREDDEVPAGW